MKNANFSLWADVQLLRLRHSAGSVFVIWAWIVAMLSLGMISAGAQSFSLERNQVNIAAAPEYSHTPVRVGVTSATPGFNVGQLTLSSDSTWVVPTSDLESGDIVLIFNTADLISSSSTATISLSLGDETHSLFVKATLQPLNIVKLEADPVRSRVYGIHMNGEGLGTVVMMDPVAGTPLNNVTVGRRPTDMAFSGDGSELLVINAVDESISVIDLPTFTLKEVLKLPTFENWGASSTTADIAVGNGSIIYYTDGSWAPVLHVYNRSTNQVLQSVSVGEHGIGDIGLNSDRSALFGWIQYGWSAGWSGSYVVKYIVNANGTLNFVEPPDTPQPTGISRDPLDAPVLVARDDKQVFLKQIAVDSGNFRQTLHNFPKTVYSISPGGEIAATDSAIYEVKTGNKLHDLPVASPVQTISSDYSRFVYYDSRSRSLESLNLIELIGPSIISRDIRPPDQSVSNPPEELVWESAPGAARYQIYMGRDFSQVSSASSSSPWYLGETTSTQWTLDPAVFTGGLTYYWRVDVVLPSEKVKGNAFSFTVSDISPNVTAINVTTLQGHRNMQTSFQLNSAQPGSAWDIKAQHPWVTFSVDSGTTPATVEIFLDASKLTVGTHNTSLTVSNGNVEYFSLPLRLRVEPVKLTHLKSRKDSVFVYGISEDTLNASSRAYLFELNTLTREINRVVAVGSSATDLAVHELENRIYVPNWLDGALLAVDLDTFTIARTYAFAPFAGVGYSRDDVYRVSAGARGRVIVEAQDQWVSLRIFDTVNGVELATTLVREGGGGATSNGRFYYHGDNNSSGANLRKYDLLGDQLSLIGSARISPVNGFGSRVIQVSDDGQRIFWNGVVYKQDLSAEWLIGEHIHAISPDGDYAFGLTNIFDVSNQRLLSVSTPNSTVKAFNPITDTLVYFADNGLDFMRLGSRAETTPGNGDVIFGVDSLTWEKLPVDATYHVFLGSSESSVSTADRESDEYLGETLSNSFTLESGNAQGRYFWRVDAMTEFGLIPGRVLNFTVSSIIPDQLSVSQVTFPGRDVVVTVPLSAQVAGTSWAVDTEAEWISLDAISGETPGVISMILSAGDSGQVQSAVINIRSEGEVLYSLPVELITETFRITHLKSHRQSAKVFAVSENISDQHSNAYLLEVDSEQEIITRIVEVGQSVTDLAVHIPDNRIYIPNWQEGKLIAVDMTTFQVVQTYSLDSPSFRGVDVYRVTPGSKGRLIIEPEDQWINIALFDTEAGTILNTVRAREGGGGSDPSGQFYYHGDNDSSGAQLHRYSLLGDSFTDRGKAQSFSAGGYGSRVIQVSEQGNRIFWNGSVFTANLNMEWEFGEHIYATSPSGKYAFGESEIYDIDQRSVVLGMPRPTMVSAFNGTSSKLIIQEGGVLGFYLIPSPLALPAPILTVTDVGQSSVELEWTDRSLETGFTIQRRLTGSPHWVDSGTVAMNTSRTRVSGLPGQTGFEFRIKADSSTISSPWSELVQVTTLAPPPGIPRMLKPDVTHASVRLSWTNPDDETELLLERQTGQNWSLLATLPGDTVSFIDTGVILGQRYSYRIKSRNLAGDSGYSNIVIANVPQPQPPDTPVSLTAFVINSGLVRLSWSDVANEDGYNIERTHPGQSSWTLVARLLADQVTFEDNSVTSAQTYQYRVRAFNSVGYSRYSNIAEVTTTEFQIIFADDFDPHADAVWARIHGALNLNAGTGFPGSRTLWFGGADQRQAATVPVNVSSGGQIRFMIRGGNSSVDGIQYWNESGTGGNVQLEYSINDDWHLIRPIDLDGTDSREWKLYVVDIPSSASSESTRFRWVQGGPLNENQRVWALDDVSIHTKVIPQPGEPANVESGTKFSTRAEIVWGQAPHAVNIIIERQVNDEWIEIAHVNAASGAYEDDGLMPVTTYNYRVKSVNPRGESGYTYTSVTTWSQLDEWLYAQYGSTDSIDLTASDVHGITLAHRFAFNLGGVDTPTWHVPGISERGLPAMWFEPDQARLMVEFVRRKPLVNPGVTYTVQFSTDLKIWIDATAPFATIPVDSIWERVRYSDPQSTVESPHRFSRVIINVR